LGNGRECHAEEAIAQDKGPGRLVGSQEGLIPRLAIRVEHVSHGRTTCLTT